MSQQLHVLQSTSLVDSNCLQRKCNESSPTYFRFWQDQEATTRIAPTAIPSCQKNGDGESCFPLRRQRQRERQPHRQPQRRRITLNLNASDNVCSTRNTRMISLKQHAVRLLSKCLPLLLLFFNPLVKTIYTTSNTFLSPSSFVRIAVVLSSVLLLSLENVSTVVNAAVDPSSSPDVKFPVCITTRRNIPSNTQQSIQAIDCQKKCSNRYERWRDKDIDMSTLNINDSSSIPSNVHTIPLITIFSMTGGSRKRKSIALCSKTALKTLLSSSFHPLSKLPTSPTQLVNRTRKITTQTQTKYAASGSTNSLKISSTTSKSFAASSLASSSSSSLSSTSSSSSFMYIIKTGLAGGIAGATGTTLLYPFDSAKTLRQSSPNQFPSVLSALRYMLLYKNNNYYNNNNINSIKINNSHEHVIAATATAASTSIARRRNLVLDVFRVPFKSVTSMNYGRVYKGLFTSVLGSIPSSALYFGSYEMGKILIRKTIQHQSSRTSVPKKESTNNVQTPVRTANANAKSTSMNKNIDENTSVGEETFSQRLLVHGCAAACGNIISSAVFVPKELIKQRMQYLGGGQQQQYQQVLLSSLLSSSSSGGVVTTIQTIIKEKGVQGLYCGYRAVLVRNIPTAAIRFCLYEEFKRMLLVRHYRSSTTPRTGDDSASTTTTTTTTTIHNYDKNRINTIQTPLSWQLFVAGAVAGAVASGLMTPADVVKTRLSTGFCSIDDGVSYGILGCAQRIVRDSGWVSLYAGAGSRVFFSAAFSGIGFGTFEMTKNLLGLNNNNNNNKSNNVLPSTATSVTQTK